MDSIFIKIGGVLALLTALFFSEQYIEGLGAKKEVLACSAKIEAGNAQAGRDLAAATAKVADQQIKLQAMVDKQNIEDSKHAETSAILTDHIHTLAALYAGRLRDPNASPSQGGGSCSGAVSQVAGPAGSSPADGSQTGGLLSAELTGLLQRVQLEADAINDAYASCKSDAISIRALLSGSSSSGAAPVSVVHSP